VGQIARAASETVTLGTLAHPSGNVSSTAAIGIVILALGIAGILYAPEVPPLAPQIDGNDDDGLDD
jgi:hypothetical protein